MNFQNDNMHVLQNILTDRVGDLSIALSGGIDSITLMRIAAEVRSAPTIAVHAVSAAVPTEATLRCRRLARQYNWQLVEIDAGEFSDGRYISNPVNRCYYCKSSLFDSIINQLAANTCIATGTNTDDLGDYRPGLKAADERDVWQPYVEAGIDKKSIRDLALQFGLGEISQLPAQPCLSSRIETGIKINIDDLGFVHRMERELTRQLGQGDIRCRIVSEGVVVQLPVNSDVFIDAVKRQRINEVVEKVCDDGGRSLVKIEPYKMGSAFLRSNVEKTYD